MSLRVACLAPMLFASCAEEAALAPCGDEGLQRLESPGTPEERRYDVVLAGLQAQLHASVGKYVDGSWPSYRGAVRMVVETNSSTYGHRRTQALGLAYGVLTDDLQPINVPQDGEIAAHGH